uniref:Rad21/Rec8-like protein N-terminal domain-containing protein n=1 Tax=Palpitomonas bilix TaxID=652834 RepID=A0A7S3DJ52_9EUKA|mmetsp:Transcript_40387/g.104710  ORF Transcript_40387/g.104710 Transcript_40387/m.104710 type:complete len:785 (+) Transcript_40387:204-2558(+)|eukprot:CAMPEP_0113896856 /NCGR_PEP_ID=MMETSP0780_2-20120614/18299_1 /TAXON_ID=652834 /ORGANISM="Palpitomonas bilix" /LENGTH=784 /DNA_ID=CAMNT_0000888141 /DNA_START=28 /DNA_END=2382 /DNA_ORIENTATION=- /assembly_acc=CAM_ASM_000599
MLLTHYQFADNPVLGRLWIAAHNEKKVTKSQVVQANLMEAVDELLKPNLSISMRLAAHLLYGVVVVYARKAKYLMGDSSDALVKLRVAFQSRSRVDLEENEGSAEVGAITINGQRKRNSPGSRAKRRGVGASLSPRASLLLSPALSTSRVDEDNERFEELDGEDDIEASQNLLHTDISPMREGRSSVGRAGRSSIEAANEDISLSSARRTRRSLAFGGDVLPITASTNTSAIDLGEDLGTDLALGDEVFGDDLLMSFEVDNEVGEAPPRTRTSIASPSSRRIGAGVGGEDPLSPPPAAADESSMEVEVARGGESGVHEGLDISAASMAEDGEIEVGRDAPRVDGAHLDISEIEPVADMDMGGDLDVMEMEEPVLEGGEVGGEGEGEDGANRGEGEGGEEGQRTRSRRRIVPPSRLIDEQTELPGASIKRYLKNPRRLIQKRSKAPLSAAAVRSAKETAKDKRRRLSSAMSAQNGLAEPLAALLNESSSSGSGQAGEGGESVVNESRRSRRSLQLRRRSEAPSAEGGEGQEGSMTENVEGEESAVVPAAGEGGEEGGLDMTDMGEIGDFAAAEELPMEDMSLHFEGEGAPSPIRGEAEVEREEERRREGEEQDRREPKRSRQDRGGEEEEEEVEREGEYPADSSSLQRRIVGEEEADSFVSEASIMSAVVREDTVAAESLALLEAIHTKTEEKRRAAPPPVGHTQTRSGRRAALTATSITFTDIVSKEGEGARKAAALSFFCLLDVKSKYNCVGVSQDEEFGDINIRPMENLDESIRRFSAGRVF